MLATVLLAFWACMRTSAAAQDVPPAQFTALEAALAEGGAAALDFHVTAEGAFSADLRGRLQLGAAGAAVLRGRGTFGGDSVDLVLRAADGSMAWGNNGARAAGPTPARLREALAIGFTRMGILHNLARLTANSAPDHAEGGVRRWVVVHGFRPGATPDTVAFDLTVAGTPSGSATLAFDANGAPVVRHQTVVFPGGEMPVVERYANVRLEPPPAPGGVAPASVRPNGSPHTHF